MLLPVRLRVHRSRSGQPRQATPKVTCPVRLTGRVTPFGQVIVPASTLTVKSSTVNPPGTAALIGQGLTSGACPATDSAASISPVP